ncbi:hypothetical protein IFM89_015831 [Coptis chinensis]|uniref:Ataxin-10 domain-containing protein n=1 Tax=Coptis chinensis TaxID=261450 RepID=A0A835MBK5_9MAGN|nr:hypothetical protein IFM89_015831 [Coptis chinensis]
MEHTVLPELDVPEHVLQPLLSIANCSTLNSALEKLISSARTEYGRSALAAINIIPLVLQLVKSLSTLETRSFLSSSLKLLRNLSAGEVQNQNSFITNKGVETISISLKSVVKYSDSDQGVVRAGLQLLGNVSLAGEEHQRAIWHHFFPYQFMEIARIRKTEICDALCMVIYTCCSGSNEREGELCGVQGLKIVTKIIGTASQVGFAEDWFQWLVSKLCLEESHFPTFFYQLGVDVVVNSEDLNCKVAVFSEEQAFLLGVLSEVLNQQTDDISVSNECIMCVLGILKKALVTVDFSSRGKSGLPTGIPAVDVLGYSITILRDVCANYGSADSAGSVTVVDSLLSCGLLELLLNILRNLEPPEIIRNSSSRGENQDRAHDLLKKSPYKGFRRDIVAVTGNCLYGRKHAQDEIRQRNGIVLLLQQCVTDEDNPFLREWGIWLKRNLLLENNENKQEVAELELQGVVDAPELARLGLRVEVDQITRRLKLVNVT